MKLKLIQVLVSGLLAAFCLFASSVQAETDAAREKAISIIEEVVEANGGMEAFKAKNSVQYTYIYRTPDGKEDISIEKYSFDGEKSWAKYTKRQYTAPEVKGELVQVFDGQTTRAYIDGKESKDESLVKTSDFLRKTNYYWFAMMFKLLDPGMIYDYEGTRTIERTTYDTVRITYEPGIGDVSDTYILFVNPKTKLIDRFLFTVMDFGIKDPLLMTVEYEEVEGLKIPALRKYTKGSWKGLPSEPNPSWTDEITTNVKFDISTEGLF